MKLIKFIVAGLMLSFPVVASAEEIINTRTVIQLISNPTHALVQLNTPGQNLEGCGSATLLKLNYEGQREMYATLLSAFMTGRTVDIFVNGCSGVNGNITRLDVHQ